MVVVSFLFFVSEYGVIDRYEFFFGFAYVEVGGFFDGVFTHLDAICISGRDVQSGYAVIHQVWYSSCW